jgi:hypothetical protein
MIANHPIFLRRTRKCLRKNPEDVLLQRINYAFSSNTNPAEKSGEIGALLRREGLYHSNISTWRKQRDQGALQGLTPRKRGRNTKKTDPMVQKLARLEPENRQLVKKLKQAEAIIEVQKKSRMRIPRFREIGVKKFLLEDFSPFSQIPLSAPCPDFVSAELRLDKLGFRQKAR